mmetsp:Transcript_39648/g.64310  ORF Transcript_39648/g.64310 Transcript_39648/m.64310 type:complete len:524 (+) Transcript_39648:196-1767(+)
MQKGCLRRNYRTPLVATKAMEIPSVLLRHFLVCMDELSAYVQLLLRMVKGAAEEQQESRENVDTQDPDEFESNGETYVNQQEQATLYNNEDDFDEDDEEPQPANGNWEDRSSIEFSNDTTAAQARAGRDIQGIPWRELLFTRDQYRETRLGQYKNYQNLTNREGHDEHRAQEIIRARKDGQFFSFFHNTRQLRCSIIHFQLRNLVWATSPHDVYTMYNHTISRYSPLTRQSVPVLQFTGAHFGLGAPADTAHSHSHRTNDVLMMQRVQISTIVVRGNILIAGGFAGELVCKDLKRNEILANMRVSHDDNAITNAIHLYSPPTGGLRAVTSNNDCMVRMWDLPTFTNVWQQEYPFAVNHTSTSPDGRLMCIVGDDTDALLTDIRSSQKVATLKGHSDFSFASAWHPNGHIFATGNQDCTARLWDVRKLGSSYGVLSGHMGAIRSLRFTSDGKFLAMAEPADFVHIFDCSADYRRCQEIDLFGEIAGISFSPDDDALFIGISDRTYGSLMEFRRRNFGLLQNVLV